MPCVFRRCSTTSSFATSRDGSDRHRGRRGAATWVHLALGLDAALGLAEEPVGMVQRDAGHAEEQDGRQAEHRQVDVQPAHQRGEPDGEPAPERPAAAPGVARRVAIFAGALRRYSIEADLISTLPLSSSANGVSARVTGLRML